MPIRFAIFPEQRLFVVKFVGIVTGDELIDAYVAIFDHPDFEPGMDELSDMRRVEALDYQLDALKRVADITERRLGAAGVSMRTAHVIGSEFNEGLSRLYGAITELGDSETVNRFKTLKEGLAWLSRPDFPHRLIDDI